ncbi:MAG: Sporulation Domain-Containing Protein, partial [Chitinophagaceae bacterium]|nr:Sporulation Domain-Containing Protein [Chitinophagaceae bacterium]
KKKFAFFFKWQITLCFVFCSLFKPGIGWAQLVDNFNYTEISVTLNVARLGSMELPVVIHGPVIYLPVKEIFDFLRIKNVRSSDMDSISGFFINPRVTYLIDKMSNRIQYDGEIFQLNPGDIIRTETNLYLKEEYFREVFGLDCSFNFRSLTITLTTKIELPAIREMQQEIMRRNISQFKDEKKADTIMKRSFPKFHLGIADWAIIARQQTNGKPNTGLNLNIGSIIAGGETNVSLNYNSDQPLNLKQQYYNWKYVNNDRNFLRQIIAGKLLVQSTSSIYTPVTGVQLTNTPTTYRKSFGTYRLNSSTEPGWMVELYVNNILINYTKADASGFFTFDVPLVYGNTTVKLRVYGPYGEERSREQTISIPFNFLPFHQFEYNLTVGVVDDEQKSKFSRVDANYGLSKRITVGAGAEYLSSVASGKAMPFLNASFRAGSNLLVSAEHIYGVRTKGILSYKLPANIQIDFTYSKYDPKQTAIKYNYRAEKKIVISIPFHTRNLNAFSRLTINQFTLPESKYTTAEFLLSGVVAGISSNLTTNAIFADPNHPLVYSNLSQTFRLPGGLRVSPQVQYEYMRKRFSMIRCEIEKSIFTNGLINFSYQKDIAINAATTGLGIRYNFAFAQTALNLTQSNHTTTLIQSARGSLIYNGKTKYLGTYNQSSIGKGGVIIIPFLDINCNGSWDPNEPKAFGLSLHINSGRIERSNNDTSIRILGLEAYNNYFIELEKNSFENIAWQIRKPTIRVTIDPDYIQKIEVPVTVMGEVSGNVSLNGEKGSAGLGRMIVNFYSTDSTLAGRTLSEEDGYFSFLGLAPGKYTAAIDTFQLRNLNFLSLTKPLPFTIKSSIEGDVSDGLEFKLLSLTVKNHPEPFIQKNEILVHHGEDTGASAIPLKGNDQNPGRKDTIDQKNGISLTYQNKQNLLARPTVPAKKILPAQRGIHPSRQQPSIQHRLDTLISKESQPLKNIPIWVDRHRLSRYKQNSKYPANNINKNHKGLKDHISALLKSKPASGAHNTPVDIMLNKIRHLNQGKDELLEKEQVAVYQKLQIISQIQQYIIIEQYSILRKKGIKIKEVSFLPGHKEVVIKKQNLSAIIVRKKRIIGMQELKIKKLDSIIINKK